MFNSKKKVLNVVFGKLSFFQNNLLLVINTNLSLRSLAFRLKLLFETLVSHAESTFTLNMLVILVHHFFPKSVDFADFDHSPGASRVLR